MLDHLLVLAMTAFLMMRGAGAVSIDRAIRNGITTTRPSLARS
jgi:hypothetical protein